jgi:formylglycine-generating enzyme required for sulfatase activity
MRNRLLFGAVCALASFVQAASAVTMDWVDVGGPGNNCDATPAHGLGCFGTVASAYRIGKYEVTNSQYVEFLNAVAVDDPNHLYDLAMGQATGGITRSGSAGSYTYATVAGREDKPVNFVSWYSSARFVNWLANGQPTGAQGSGTTETGTYTLTGINNISGGRALGATIFLPTEDEWYKAAYYDAALGLYYDFPAGTNTQTVCAAPTATPNRANCSNAVLNTTDVGSYTGSASPFGTFDQGGNVLEWIEKDYAGDGATMGQMGGNWNSGSFDMSSGPAGGQDSETISDHFGFRLASVPEPATSSLYLTAVFTLTLHLRRRSV